MMSQETTFIEAIRQGITEEMASDPTVCLLTGGDQSGHPSQVARGLRTQHGEEQIITTTLAPAALIHAATGAALMGMRPIVELEHGGQLSDVLGTLAKLVGPLHWRTGGDLYLPLVLRVPLFDAVAGGSWRALHSEGLLAALPGLYVVVPTTPYDAKGLIKTAIREQNPVIFLEPKYLYHRLHEALPTEPYVIPLGQAEVRLDGDDVTVLTYGAMAYTALDAAQQLATEGITVDVIDLRSLAPLDHELIRESIARTHRVAIVHDAPASGGISAHLAQLVLHTCADLLVAPPICVTAPELPTPLAPALEAAYLPNVTSICTAVRTLLTNGDSFS